MNRDLASTITNSQLKEGYKQTEVGIIPEDWSVYKIQELIDQKTIVEHLDGNHGELYPKSHEFQSYGIPYITANDLGHRFVSFQNCKFLSQDRASLFRKGIAKNNDVLFAHNATVGPVSLLSTNLEYVILSTTATYFRCDMQKINNYFLLYLLQSSLFVKQYQPVMAQSTRNQVPITAQRKLFIPLPPTKAEQEAIASTLSDIDALIESLDRLLTKKRQIKQGTVQELLRSKDGWKSAKLKDISPLQRGFDLPSSQLAQGVYPVVYSNGIQNYHERYMVREPGITTGRSGTLGVVNFITEKFWPHNTTLWVTDFKGNDPKFIYYLYIYIGFERFGSGSGVPTLNRNDAHDYICSIPTQLSEQIEIANILSDMDAEIESISAKLAKTRQLKQGMMHELLTGRIRLVDK